MWQTLRDNPEVLWGFVLALVVVVILTPAVGRFARILGVVDEPGERRRIHLRPIPRLGGIALLLGIFIPALAFLTLDGVYRGILLGAAVATFVGVVDDPENPREAPDRGRQDDDDDQREQEAPENLRIVTQRLPHSLERDYFVPYNRSPASPRPGTM